METNKGLTPLACDLLARVIERGLADGFAYLDAVALRERVKFITAFERLIDEGCVERVPEGIGYWWYRLTATGREAAMRKKPAPQPEAKSDRNKRHRPFRRKKRATVGAAK